MNNYSFFALFRRLKDAGLNPWCEHYHYKTVVTYEDNDIPYKMIIKRTRGGYVLLYERDKIILVYHPKP